MLIRLIAYLALLSIVILTFSMIVLITLHVWIHCYKPFDSTYWFTCLYIILIVFEHDVCITFHLIVIVCMWTWVIYLVLCLTACCMIALLLRDFMLLVHVGRTSIPLPPTLLVSIIPFIPVFTITNVRPSVCLLFLIEPEIRSRVYRRAISMFGSILEITNTLMLIGVRSLKTCIALSYVSWIFVRPVCFLFCFSFLGFFRCTHTIHYAL